MKQSKIDSVLEALVNILIGSIVALIAQVIWFPIIGKEFTIGEHLSTTLFFTFISFARSYIIRRLFNGRSIYMSIKNAIK